MMMQEDAAIPVAALPIAELRDHLRLGSGFGADGVQDGLIESYLRAALLAIEGRIGKALIARRVTWLLDDWRHAQAQALPVAPVTSIVSVTLVDGIGGRQTLLPASYRLVADLHRPKLVARGSALPPVPVDGLAEIVFIAGFGAAWLEVPPDLRQAVLLLAAEFYEKRDEMGLREQGLPFGIMALIERWRTVRVLGGGRA